MVSGDMSRASHKGYLCNLLLIFDLFFTESGRLCQPFAPEQSECVDNSAFPGR